MIRPGRAVTLGLLACLGLLAGVGLGPAVTPPARAQSHMDKALFLELAADPGSRGWGLMLVHLKGVLAGLEAANMQLVRRGDQALFCLPPGTMTTPEWTANALRDYLARYPKIPDNASIAVLATFMLAEDFPCPEAT